MKILLDDEGMKLEGESLLEDLKVSAFCSWVLEFELVLLLLLHSRFFDHRLGVSLLFPPPCQNITALDEDLMKT